MSIVGPRPDLPGADVEIYRPGDKKKLEVAPGITGYSQVYYRNSSTLEQRFDGDVFYAENVSLLLDISILFKSFGIVITHKNVYRN
jgi:lipopolysaccharide/colanic/teichoic acid biosynthesis glycosyltransferase